MGSPDADNPNPPSSRPSPMGWTPPAVEEVDALVPGRYEVLELLGAGGMAAVYKARHAALNRIVAIKILPVASTGEADGFNFTERFKLEAQAMANLSHPGIVGVHDFGQTDGGLFYFVMEYVDGMDVVGYLREHGGRLPEEHALTITAHVLDALAYAHEHGIIHRDIKPANVLISSEGQIKIADFGLAKHSAAPASAGLTRTNMTMGTPDFVAPEALTSGTQIDHRADIYAVGVMLYQMLTRELPRGRFKLPAEKVPGLDRRIDPVVEKAMVSEPEGRYQSAGEMRSAVDKLFTAPVARVTPDSPSTAIPVIPKKGTPPPGAEVRAEAPAAPSTSRRPLYAALGSAAGLAVVALLAWVIFSPPGEVTVHPDVAEGPIANPPHTGSVPAREQRTEPAPVKEPAGPVANAEVPPEPEKANADAPAKPAAPKPKNAGAKMADTNPAAGVGAKVAPAAEPPGETPGPPSGAPATAPGDKPEAKAETAGSPGEPPDPASPELEALKKRFEELEAEEIGALDANYVKAIGREIEKAADAGDLAAVTALRAEKKRIAEKEPLPALADGAEPEGTPAGLAELRKIYRPELAKERATLLGKYQNALKQLEAQLTKDRKFDDAVAVKAFRESLTTPTPAPLQPGTGNPEPRTATPSPTNTALSPAVATKEKPFENSLGMRFVPVPIRGGPSNRETVLFSVWETRVADYEKFIRKDRGRDWPEPGFKQGDDHPAVNVSWEDAVAFCDWLTEEERKKGLIGKDDRYRLPSDHEWSCAVGIGREEDADSLPAAKDRKLPDVFPWGEEWPPPKGAGNYYGEETARDPINETRKPIEGYEDGFERTAPVGSFAPNEDGLYDLGGNVWEWCEDWYSSDRKERVRRGASWNYSLRVYLLSSYRYHYAPGIRNDYYGLGFRCVLGR